MSGEGPAPARASIRVLAISSYGVLGGAELALAEFVAHRPQGVKVSAALVEDGPLKERLQALGTDVSAAPGDYDGRPTPAAIGRFSRWLGALNRRLEPDVVWAMGLKAAFMAVPACRARRVPLVWHKVDFSLDGVLALPLAAATDGVVCVSQAVSEALGPLRRRRLLAVVGPPMRLEPELRVNPDPGKPAIGTLATFVPIKGQAHIIEAAGILCQEFPSLRVVLAGIQPAEHSGYLQELRALAARVGLGERLQILDFVEDVTGVLSDMTVFVNATYRAERHFGREGLSGSMLEASWAGLPVVATRGGGSAEGLIDGLTGTLVDPGDPVALAGAVARYLRDPELARRTGEAGRAFTREHFAPEKVAAALFDALARTSGRRHSAGRGR